MHVYRTSATKQYSVQNACTLTCTSTNNEESTICCILQCIYKISDHGLTIFFTSVTPVALQYRTLAFGSILDKCKSYDWSRVIFIEIKPLLCSNLPIHVYMYLVVRIWCKSIRGHVWATFLDHLFQKYSANGWQTFLFILVYSGLMHVNLHTIYVSFKISIKKSIFLYT